MIVVEGSEAREVNCVRVIRNSVGSVGAEGEVVDDGAVAIWRRRSEALITKKKSKEDAMLTEGIRKG